MTADELNEFWASAGCFLAGFSDTPCEGRLIRAHLIPKQLIRRECGSLSPKGWRFIADDPRCWVWACGGAMGPSGHHGMLDYSRTIRIPRSSLPPELELFAAEFGLGWWLIRTYGPRCDHCDDAGEVFEPCDCYECEYGGMHNRYIPCANCQDIAP